MVTLTRASSIATAKTWWSMWRLKDGTCPVPFVGCGCVSVCLLRMTEEKPKRVTANNRNRTEYLAPETSCAFYDRVSTGTRLVDRPVHSVQLGDSSTTHKIIVSPVPHSGSLQLARSSNLPPRTASP